MRGAPGAVTHPPPRDSYVALSKDGDREYGLSALGEPGSKPHCLPCEGNQRFIDFHRLTHKARAQDKVFDTTNRTTIAVYAVCLEPPLAPNSWADLYDSLN